MVFEGIAAVRRAAGNILPDRSRHTPCAEGSAHGVCGLLSPAARLNVGLELLTEFFNGRCGVCGQSAFQLRSFALQSRCIAEPAAVDISSSANPSATAGTLKTVSLCR